MTETKIELIQSECGCSAEGGQCCSSGENKTETKTECACGSE